MQTEDVMKGIVVDCKTGKVQQVDDGLPPPPFTPPPPPHTLDLDQVAGAIKKVDELDSRVKALEKASVLRL
jgi:hypothetical protein